MTEENQADDLREALLDGWDAAAPGWARQAERWRDATKPVTDWLLSAAAPKTGEHVIELASGAGDVGLSAAALLAPGGNVICSDAAEPMLAIARERADELGLENVEFKQLQLEWIDLPTASADVVLCRWGLMFALDPLAALKECRRILKPGGRLALAVWDLPDVNPWKTVPRQALVDLDLVEPADANARLFSLSDRSQLLELIDDAGLFDARIDQVSIAREFDSVLDFIGVSCDQSTDFGTVWKRLGDQDRQRVRALLSDRTTEYRTGTGEQLLLPGTALGLLAEA